MSSGLLFIFQLSLIFLLLPLKFKVQKFLKPIHDKLARDGKSPRKAVHSFIQLTVVCVALWCCLSQATETIMPDP